MTVTITRLYDDYASAERAVRDLEAAGVPHNDISIVSNNADSWYKGSSRAGTTATPRTTTGRVDRDHDGVDDRAEGAGAGAGIGATLGGAAGFLAGLGLLAIPGLGPRGRRGLACLHGSWRPRRWCHRRHHRCAYSSRCEGRGCSTLCRRHPARRDVGVGTCAGHGSCAL